MKALFLALSLLHPGPSLHGLRVTNGDSPFQGDRPPAGDREPERRPVPRRGDRLVPARSGGDGADGRRSDGHDPRRPALHADRLVDVRAPAVRTAPACLAAGPLDAAAHIHPPADGDGSGRRHPLRLLPALRAHPRERAGRPRPGDRRPLHAAQLRAGTAGSGLARERREVARARGLLVPSPARGRPRSEDERQPDDAAAALPLEKQAERYPPHPLRPRRRLAERPLLLRANAPGGRLAYAPFVVRPRVFGSQSRVAVVLSTNTWQAYNFRDANGDGCGDSWYVSNAITPSTSSARSSTSASRSASATRTSTSFAG